MRRKVTRFTLLIVMLLTMFPAWSYDFEVDGIFYSVVSLSDLTCKVVSGDEKYEGDVKIPTEIEYNNRKLQVVSIDEKAFYMCRSLTSVEYQGAIAIEKEAFYMCYKLISAKFPNVTSIGADAFSGCSSLTSIEFPNVTSIGALAFYKCSSLTSVEFPNVTSIGEKTFISCTSLTSVEFPNVTSIGENTFCRCTSLTSVEFPNVTSIGADAFSECSSLASVEFPNVTSIGARAFSGCSSLTSVEFPNVTSIGADAFSGCSSLTSVEFPNVTSIGADAFSRCSSLTSAEFPNVTSMGAGIFSNCSNLKLVSFPILEGIQYGTFSGCSNLKTLTIPGSTISLETFYVYSEEYASHGTVNFNDITFSGVSLKELRFENGSGMLDFLYSYYISYHNKPGDGQEEISNIFTSDITAERIKNKRVFTFNGNLLSVENLYIDREFSPNPIRFADLKNLTLGEHITEVCLDLEYQDKLELIVSNATTPPSLPKLTNPQYINLKVVVPDEALEAYKAAPGWQNFWNLQGMAESGVESTMAKNEVTEVGRYDLNGRQVTGDYKGITIVRYSDGSTKKVITK